MREQGTKGGEGGGGRGGKGEGGKGERVRYLVINYHLHIALDSVINWFP